MYWNEDDAMKCNAIKKRLSAFQDGRLTDEEKHQIELHMDACRSCSQKFHELSVVWSLLSVLPVSEPLPFFYTRLEKRMAARSADHRFHWIEKAVMPAATLAMVALGMVVGSLAVKFSEDLISSDPVFSELPAESMGLFSEEPLSNGYFELFGQEGGASE
jgi:predicted anti-sigma-YlaC factor YlaD